MESPWLTWANLLTIIRLISTLPMTLAILDQQWIAASAIFVLAVATDIWDGRLARRLQQTSSLGGLLDHATDACFVTCGCAALAYLEFMTPVLSVLIPLAFVQYMWDSKALSGINLRTSLIGKSNGIAYFVIVGIVVGANTLNLPALFVPAQWFAWLLVVATVVSMLDRAITVWRSTR